MPAVATTVNACFAVPPIIRGHALRTFVEIHTPEQRYTDVANWLQLGPLVEVQKNIRALRTQVKAASEDGTALQRVDTQLAREAAQVLKAWDSAAILAYANMSVLAPLDASLVLAALTAGDPAYLGLEARAKAEENKIGLAGLRQIRNAAAALWAELTDAESGETVVSGAIPTFDGAVGVLSAAVAEEAEERGKAASTVFQALWKAAEPLFAEGAPAPAVCPVCETPVAETAAGSAEAIRGHIANHLEELLKDAKLAPALVPGVNNRFLDSLVKGEIENFGSHFQDGLYGGGSIGDEKARWEEFKAFRSQFACKKCSRKKFQRPFTLKKPVCAHDGCEAQFEFAVAPAGLA